MAGSAVRAAALPAGGAAGPGRRGAPSATHHLPLSDLSPLHPAGDGGPGADGLAGVTPCPPGDCVWLQGALRARGRGRQERSRPSEPSVSPQKMDDDDDDIPQLSSHTLAALQEFYLEQQQREGMKTSQGFNQYSIGSIEEDWQLSQFWYSDETASCLAKEAVLAAGKGGRIACISAPSVYQKLKEQDGEDFSVCILEYDRRFSVYGEEFIFYDYNHPLDLPENLLPHSFDIVIADPPYLSEECLQKTAETIKYLTKGKILLCTGAVMEEQAAKHLGVKMCKFIPKHSRNLANEFRCYVNYASGLD